MITILETAPLNTVQDNGRSGYRNLGIGTSGVMDPLAFQVGNILLDNAPSSACIEIQTFPFAIRFDDITSFTLTGIDAPLALNDRPILPWSVDTASPGDVLRVDMPTVGARAYLCVAGGIDVPMVLGSRSTQLRGSFGGHEGRFLTAGDQLATGPQGAPLSGYGAVPPTVAFGLAQDETVTLRAIPATDYLLFTESARRQFWDLAWRITPQSNRVGYRFSGTPLTLTRPVELRSYGIVSGIIQVPPAGEPIVQLAEANTAGGYPRIATVIEADLWRLAQARIGRSIRFVECDHQAGVAATGATTDYLENLRSMVGYYRTSMRRRDTGAPGD